MVIGRGSNLLVRDGGIPGVVVHLARGEFAHHEIQGMEISAGVGVKFKQLTGLARTAGIAGFEWMEGIPGNIGGAVRMNAGAMGTYTFDQVVSIRYLDTDGAIKEKTRAEIAHHYRSVPEFEDRFILSAKLKGSAASLEQIDTGLEASRAKRRKSQPIGASAGCCFKNPEFCGAGQLVDQLGLKGSRVGRAVVSDVHGNFIVNEGHATAREVLDLIANIQETAQREQDLYNLYLWHKEWSITAARTSGLMSLQSRPCAARVTDR
jgi:UDP-N-acetylenolpyruvoylglucosamine reductase